MKKISAVILALSGLVLAGCGGGDSSPTPETIRLAPYIGTWMEACDGHEQGKLVVARTSSDTVNITSTMQFYANAGCTGAVLGTETSTANATMTYTGTVDAPTILSTGTTATTRKIDLVTVRVPQGATSVTGTGVVRVVKDGQPQWCVAYSDGVTTCIHDLGTEAAQGPISAGLYANATEMFLLIANSGTYAVDLRVTK